MSNSITETPRRRPVGVTIIAVLDIIVGLLVLIGAILGFLGLGLAGERIPGAIDAVAGVALGVAIIIGIAELVVGWGLWTLKRWAFWTTVVLEILTIADHLFAWFAHHISIASLIGNIVIPVIIIVYLFADRNVREAFRT
jgi:uncharacterized membrane protein (DUF2068 family)